MQPDNGRSISAWVATAGLDSRTALAKDASADVCVVGAGIAGLMTAYLLTKEGKSVIVLDDGAIAGGETSRTTAHLTNALDDRYFDLEKYHGVEGSKLAADSHTKAIACIEQAVRDEKIDCHFARVDGYLFLHPKEKEKLLKDELAAVHRAGIKSATIVDRIPLKSFDSGPAIRFPDQGQMHPLLFLRGIAEAIEDGGGKIYGSTHASEIVGGEDAHVKTAKGHTVTAKAIVVATNTPVNDRFAIHTKQGAYRSYVIGARIPKGSVPEILLWDTGPYSESGGSVPYHYVRTMRDDEGDVLIVGGEDHLTGQKHDTEQRFANLETWTKNHFPIGDILWHWSGQVMEPVDGLAYIGHNPMDKDNVFIATGDSGNGMTHGAIAGMLLTDLIMHRKNPWADLYHPSRKSGYTTIKDFAVHNANVMKQYCDYVTPGDEPSSDKIAPGCGAVIRDGVKKIALYRDNLGQEHRMSAICPHLGCIVHWNDFEKTWDCPCHGSRFAAKGQVVNGPSNRDLEPV